MPVVPGQTLSPAAPPPAIRSRSARRRPRGRLGEEAARRRALAAQKVAGGLPHGGSLVRAWVRRHEALMRVR